jgi:cell division septum initiation protein DivIVA
MGKNTDKEGTVELWGHEFKRVKNGLDEEQIVSFVNELMNAHKTLLERAEHLSALTKLAEKTIVEADNVAKRLQEEATDQAKVEANKIIAEAEEQAQKLLQEKSAEAVVMADKEAETIKAKAQRKAELLLEEKAKRIQPVLRDITKRLCGELLSQLESLKQQVLASEEEFNRKLSQPLEETNHVSVEADKVSHEFLELTRSIDETNTGEPDWELEISPPIDLTQILDIMNHLDSLPEVTNTELIPRVDKPAITVFVREPIDLINKLRTLPQVAEVTEDATENTNGQGKPGKVQIVLSEKPPSNKTAS